MKAIQVSVFGGPDVLQYTDIPTPEPGPFQVRVRLHFAGVNPNETYVRTGTYAFHIPDLPYTPGYDGAGVVDAIGEGVTELAVGDRVFVAALLAKHSTGTYAQYVVCDAAVVHPLPPAVSFAAGASLGIPAFAAHRALMQRGRAQPGETVLVHGASGGVGVLAVQMAAALGATVIGTSSTEAGRRVVLEAGADHALPHLTPDNLDEVLAITEGRGPDLIIELLANVNLQTDLGVIAYYGRIVVAGNRGDITITPRLSMVRESDILGMALWNAPASQYYQSLCAITAMLSSGTLKPVIGERLPLSQAEQAHLAILQKAGNGKMVLQID